MIEIISLKCLSTNLLEAGVKHRDIKRLQNVLCKQQMFLFTSKEYAPAEYRFYPTSESYKRLIKVRLKRIS